jgi:hypothetical protein
VACASDATPVRGTAVSVSRADQDCDRFDHPEESELIVDIAAAIRLDKTAGWNRG